ncbi:hypothetical protein KSD_08260 [Ktedonobacter sp. SOSP1-85]|uniref:energy-coupling factor transporter transmembrane component T family protein n=1 Tax=Ktedonobacter sp. SOSP1-85 TaxID=2778367 RepID=UPI0019167FA1|nr:energy-coupling factor transporter transmembrane component T [Ktedonobacter sp. SOSP1-85]GHO73055.1 hypothetical protein KSD_08260 [Ktedonobacter sp. SOSP1-85]
MLQNLPIGVYYPGQSFLHRLRGRTKLVLLFWCAIWLYIAETRTWRFAPYIVGIILLAATISASGIVPRVLWLRMRFLLLLSLLGSLTLPFATVVPKDDQALSTLGPWPVSYSIALNGLLTILGVSLVVVASQFLRLSAVQAFWRRPWVRRLRFLAWVLLFGSLVGIWLLTGSAGTQMLALGPVFVTRLGVWYVFEVEGLLLLYAFSLLIMLTTSPVILVESVTSLMAPLRLVRFPVDDFALMLLIALRFIPTLLEEIEQLSKAQQARGASLADGTLAERFQGFTMLVIPLMRGIFQRANDLSTALEARGHAVDGKPTMLHETGLRGIDYVTLVAVLTLTISSLLL